MIPPKDPWILLEPDCEAKSNVAFYYSDSISPIPVRFVTKPGDNKADPNLETSTYGLFTTCGRGTRSAIVSNRRPYLFFSTRWNDERVLTGYYHLGWYAPHPGKKKDFALAAESIHFVENPIPLVEVNKNCGTDLSQTFRQAPLVTPTEADCLRSMLEDQPDITDNYCAEIDRLERFNASRGGFRHIGLQRDGPFTWADAENILSSPQLSVTGRDISTKSPTGMWFCRACKKIHTNERLLRVCPHCKTAHSLVPVRPPN